MSALVTITIDSDRLLEVPKGAILVEKVADYPRACLAVRTALQSRRCLTLAVRQKAVATWLTAYAQVYGEETVVVIRYTARDALTAKWHLPLPVGISDAEIIEASLLDEAISAREGQSFADLVLEHFYSDLLSFRTLPVMQLGALLAKYDADKWKMASRRPLVLRTLKERLNQWYDRAQSDSVRTLITALRDDPSGLRRDLCAFKVLKNYPLEVGKKVLAGKLEVFRKANVDTDALDLAYSAPQAATEIDYYLTGVHGDIHGPDDVETLIGQMSGHLDTEFRFIEALLRKNPEWTGPVLLRRIEQRFAPILLRVGKALAALRKLIQPAFPGKPQPDWAAAEWLLWVQNSYMPYYAWLEVQNKKDDTLTEYAVSFADWFYENFVALKNGQYERFAFTALYRENERIKSQDTVTLALIVDNFNYVYFEELCGLFRSQGMSLAGSEPLFSLIPTATEVGKAALIATKGDLIDLPTHSYPSLVDKEWNHNASGKKATYLANIGALQQVSALDHDIYFLNYLPLDEALHQNAQETGRPHSEVIYEHLETVAKTVADFATRFHLQKRLLVFILSDHGATRIAEAAVNVLDSSYYKGISDKNHHRFVAVSDEKFQALPQAASQQCYLIDRHKFKTNHNYLAARRYYRFLTTTNNFYVHGGLTPEEVVVPFARFTFVPVVPDAPTCTLISDQFRYSVRSRIQMDIGNPNGFPLENVTVRLLDADAEEVTLDNLGPKEKSTAELTATFRKSIGSSNTRTLSVRVKYGYQGAEYTAPDKEFTITMKAVMEEKDDFGDIF